MLSLRKINPMARAVGTMGVVAVMVGAVTFAQFQTNNVTLAANSVSVDTSVLRIWDGGTWSTSAPGFTNSNLTLNTEGPKHAFFLQNLQNAPLALSSQIT